MINQIQSNILILVNQDVVEWSSQLLRLLDSLGNPSLGPAEKPATWDHPEGPVPKQLTETANPLQHQF